MIALAARPLAARPDPPLNPIHPNQSNAAPKTAYPKLCGINDVSLLFPKTNATARAETPELICTTVPPAKSKAFICINHPPPHTQCAIGIYTKQAHIGIKMIHAFVFILPTSAPEISAAVKPAKAH